MEVWAMVQNGIIINTVVSSDSDPKDPSYIWVNITLYPLRPAIGWITSDNINFTQPVGD
jgi:hypothetical protein